MRWGPEIGRSPDSVGFPCKSNLLGLIPVSGGNRLADAERKALEKIGGAEALVDISVDRVGQCFILWSQLCTGVHATALSLRSPARSSRPGPVRAAGAELGYRTRRRGSSIDD